MTLALGDSAWQLEDVLGIYERLVGAAVPLLQSFGVRLGNTDSLHDVAGDVVAAVVDGPEIPDLALVKNGDVRRAGSHLDERDSQLLLVFSQNTQRTGQRLEHELAHVITSALDRLAQVHRRRGADGDEVHLGFQSGADHSNRIPDTLILVDGVLLRDRVQQLSVLWDGLRSRHLVCAVDIGFGDLVAIHGDDSLADHRAHVLSGNSRIESIDLRSRHPLGVFDRFPDRPCGLLDVGDDPLPQPGRASLTDAENFEIRRALGVGRYRLANYRRRLRRTDVQSGDDSFRIH